MIYGDPFSFAIQFDRVEAWNLDKDIWENGIFGFYVNGQNLMERVEVVELKTTMGFYSDIPRLHSKLADVVRGPALYQNAHQYFYGNSEQIIDGVMNLTCIAMADMGCYVYCREEAIGDHVIWSVDSGRTVHETTLPPGIVRSILDKIGFQKEL